MGYFWTKIITTNMDMLHNNPATQLGPQQSSLTRDTTEFLLGQQMSSLQCQASCQSHCSTLPHWWSSWCSETLPRNGPSWIKQRQLRTNSYISTYPSCSRHSTMDASLRYRFTSDTSVGIDISMAMGHRVCVCYPAHFPGSCAHIRRRNIQTVYQHEINDDKR